MAGVLAFGLALGAGGMAVAAAEMDQMSFHRGVRLAIVQRVVARALDAVGATSGQEARIHDIIAARFAEIAPNLKEHEAMRGEALQLLSAPTVDRAAVERLRADFIARLDAKSKTLIGGLLEIADQLSSEQRTQLAARIGEMTKHGDGERHGGRHAMEDLPGDEPDKQPDND